MSDVDEMDIFSSFQSHWHKCCEDLFTSLRPNFSDFLESNIWRLSRLSCPIEMAKIVTASIGYQNRKFCSCESLLNIDLLPRKKRRKFDTWYQGILTASYASPVLMGLVLGEGKVEILMLLDLLYSRYLRQKH